jgi:hypothetical protein
MTKTSKIMKTAASTTSIIPKRTVFASLDGNPLLEHTTTTKSRSPYIRDPGPPSRETSPGAYKLLLRGAKPRFKGKIPTVK